MKYLFFYLFLKKLFILNLVFSNSVIFTFFFICSLIILFLLYENFLIIKDWNQGQLIKYSHKGDPYDIHIPLIFYTSNIYFTLFKVFILLFIYLGFFVVLRFFRLGQSINLYVSFNYFTSLSFISKIGFFFIGLSCILIFILFWNTIFFLLTVELKKIHIYLAQFGSDLDYTIPFDPKNILNGGYYKKFFINEFMINRSPIIYTWYFRRIADYSYTVHIENTYNSYRYDIYNVYKNIPLILVPLHYFMWRYNKPIESPKIILLMDYLKQFSDLILPILKYLSYIFLFIYVISGIVFNNGILDNWYSILLIFFVYNRYIDLLYFYNNDFYYSSLTVCLFYYTLPKIQSATVDIFGERYLKRIFRIIKDYSCSERENVFLYHYVMQGLNVKAASNLADNIPWPGKPKNIMALWFYNKKLQVINTSVVQFILNSIEELNKYILQLHKEQNDTNIEKTIKNHENNS